jgi:hypothetical protein
VGVVGSSPYKGNAEILKAEKLKSGPGIEAGIAQQGGACGKAEIGKAESRNGTPDCETTGPLTTDHCL